MSSQSNVPRVSPAACALSWISAEASAIARTTRGFRHSRSESSHSPSGRLYRNHSGNARRQGRAIA
jgi:hypothetical protein